MRLTELSTEKVAKPTHDAPLQFYGRRNRNSGRAILVFEPAQGTDFPREYDVRGMVPTFDAILADCDHLTLCESLSTPENPLLRAVPRFIAALS